MDKYICMLRNAVIVGLTSAIIGFITMKLVDIDNKSFIKSFIIFFLIGLIVHIVLDTIGFKEICFGKKCFTMMCKIK